MFWLSPLSPPPIRSSQVQALPPGKLLLLPPSSLPGTDSICSSDENSSNTSRMCQGTVAECGLGRLGFGREIPRQEAIATFGGQKPGLQSWAHGLASIRKKYFRRGLAPSIPVGQRPHSGHLDLQAGRAHLQSLQHSGVLSGNHIHMWPLPVCGQVPVPAPT